MEGGYMKKGLFLFILMVGFSTQAAPICATKKSELPLIKNINKKVNLFGRWTGTADNKPFEAFLYVNTSEKIRGELSYDGSVYGPTDIKICEDADVFYLSAYGENVVFEVLSKKQVKAYSPFDENDTTILTKK